MKSHLAASLMAKQRDLICVASQGKGDSEPEDCQKNRCGPSLASILGGSWCRCLEELQALGL